MTILVTGGTGFIGSHTVVELLERKYKVVIIDNLCNSDESVIESIFKITKKRPEFFKGDLLDKVFLDKVFLCYKFDAVIHFAGLKAVGESVAKPLLYYENNITGTINLLESMQKYGVKKIIFSSSATVYGEQPTIPYIETMSLLPATNPYGATKAIIERILTDVVVSDLKFCAVILRYFNPIGAHPSGMIGENPKGIPNNLAPIIMQVAIGKREFLSVFGDDYKTIDGTGVRDYLHVVDLALGHIAALEKTGKTGTHIYNLGTGRGVSVLELKSAFESVVGKPIPHKILPRRAGDLAEFYADATKAKKELGWRAKYTIKDMCEHSWKFTIDKNI